jgi:hypothetical protein
LDQLRREVQANQGRYPDSWDEFDPSHHAEFEAELNRFRGNQQLDPDPGLRGGEGQLFRSGEHPFQVLKRWFRSRLGDMAESVRLLREARAAVEANPRLRALIRVVEVIRQGADWVLRDFEPTAPALGDAAASDAAAAAARSEALAALRGTTDPILQSIESKIARNSENVRWSPRDGKILVVDMQ